MSPRAAWRLERLGFERVHDYVPGKSDWLAAGLPREGEAASVPMAGDVVGEVPTCHFEAEVGEVDLGPHGLCVVVDGRGMVTGVLEAEAAQTAEGTAADHMVPAPTTVRASEPLGPLVERMERAGVEAILVTNPEGRLIGLLERHRAEEVLGEAGG